MDIISVLLILAGLVSAHFGGYLFGTGLIDQEICAVDLLMSLGLLGWGTNRLWKRTLGLIPFFEPYWLEKGRVYTLLAEVFVPKNGKWLVSVLKPDGSEFVFYSSKSLKLILGDKTQFSVIQGGHVVPLDENTCRAPRPDANNASPSPALTPSS
ncbi:MAG: hypothetical protein AAB738_03055 [Patescibacteria group bacterium]